MEQKQSLEDVFLTVLPAIVGLFPSTLYFPLISSDTINVFIILFHYVLLLIKLLENLFVNCLYYLYFLQLLCQILIIFIRSLIKSLPYLILQLFLQHFCLWLYWLFLISWFYLYQILSHYKTYLLRSPILMQHCQFQGQDLL